MKIFKVISLGLVISVVLLSTVVQAKKSENKPLCKLTIQEAENDTYSMVIPQKRIPHIRQNLDVVGINCRTQV